MSEDNNTYAKIWRRVSLAQTTPFTAMSNVAINIMYLIIVNTYLVWFTYLGALSIFLF